MQLFHENWLKLTGMLYRTINIDTYAINITERITDLANKHIPNKTVKIRSSDPPWLTNSIKRLMRKRKRLYDKYK